MDEFGSKKNIVLYQLLILFLLVVLEKSFLGSGNKKSNPGIKQAFHTIEEIGLDLPEISERTVDKPSGKDPNLVGMKTSGVFFLKFTTKGKRVTSTLIRVSRPLKGRLKDRIWAVLGELAKGPGPEESSKGIISGFPPGFKFRKKIKLSEGILYISLPRSFEEETGGELMKDRLDQLVFTLTDFPEVRGVVILIEEKRVRFLGTDMYEIPDLIRRGDRKYKEMEVEFY